MHMYVHSVREMYLATKTKYGRQKRVDLEGKGEEVGGVEGGDTVIRIYYCEKNIYFQQKRGKTQL